MKKVCVVPGTVWAWDRALFLTDYYMYQALLNNPYPFGWSLGMHPVFKDVPTFKDKLFSFLKRLLHRPTNKGQNA